MNQFGLQIQVTLERILKKEVAEIWFIQKLDGEKWNNHDDSSTDMQVSQRMIIIYNMAGGNQLYSVILMENCFMGCEDGLAIYLQVCNSALHNNP